jgi:hypothetical protein
MATTCSNSTGQPYGSTDPSTYLQTQLAKVTKPVSDRAAPTTTAPSASQPYPLNDSGRGQLLNITA